MKLTKRKFILWLGTTLLLFSILPAVNWFASYGKPQEINMESLFNTDALEGYINYFLYRLGISGNYNEVILGRNGWLFLGNNVAQVLSKTRGIKEQETSLSNIRETIKGLKQHQDWMLSKGIDNLFVIAPNKYSIYKEHHPHWLQVPDHNATDEFVKTAQQYGLNIIDMRPVLLTEKNTDPVLYYKIDTHWNLKGAFFAYRQTIHALNERYNAGIKSIDNVLFKQKPKGYGDLANLLKMSPLIPDSVDIEIKPEFSGSEAEICTQALDKQSLTPIEDCVSTKNQSFGIKKLPILVSNNNAHNPQSLLWLRDSFGTSNSSYYQQTFRQVWEIHPSALNGKKLQQFILKHQPDVVIQQIVERALYKDYFKKYFIPVKQLSIKQLSEKQLSEKQLSKKQLGSEHKPPQGLAEFSLADLQNRAFWNPHIINREISTDNHIRFQVNGKDPFIILPQLQIPSNATVILELECQTQHKSTAQLFYRHSYDKQYTESNSLRLPLKKGDNQIFIELSSAVLQHPLRYDPTHHTGEFVIKKFNLYTLIYH